MHFDIGLSNIFFLDLSPQARGIKAKSSKWDNIKLRIFAQGRKPSAKQKSTILSGGKKDVYNDISKSG